MKCCFDCGARVFDDSNSRSLRGWFHPGSELIDIPPATVCYDCAHKRNTKVAVALRKISQAGIPLVFNTADKIAAAKAALLESQDPNDFVDQAGLR